MNAECWFITIACILLFLELFIFLFYTFSKKGAILPSLFAALFLSLKSAILWFELLVVLNFNLFDYIKCGNDPPYKCSLIFLSEQLFVFIIIVLILGFELAQIVVELPNQVKHAKFILILFNTCIFIAHGFSWFVLQSTYTVILSGVMFLAIAQLVILHILTVTSKPE